MKNKLKKSISLCMTFIIIFCGVLFTDTKDCKAAKYVDLNGTYHAALGLQTCTKAWVNRFAYFDKKSNAYYGTNKANCMIAADSSAHGKKYAGTFTDVEISGNGTYTVSLSDAKFDGETDISQLHVATDIPLNNVIKFTNVSFTINGKQIADFENGYMEDEAPYLRGGMDFLLINGWRAPLVSLLEKKGLKKKDSGYALLKGSGKESISVTFTVTGFQYDHGEQAPTESAYVLPKVPAVGKTKTIKGITYKVTKSDKTKGTVSVIKHKKGKAACKIPQTITWNSYSFQVAEISSAAFSNDKKLKKVIIEKNIQKIGKNAFKGCNHLKTIDIRSKQLKINSIGTNAFATGSTTLQVKVPKGQKTAYKKLLHKAGISKKAIM